MWFSARKENFMNPIRNIALDPGFGAIKVAEVDNGQFHVVQVPSVVGVGSVDVGLLDLAGVTGRRRRPDQPHRVAFEGAEFLVGPHVGDYARPVERLDFQRLSDGAELRALTYCALHEIVNGGEVDLNLVTGLPVEVLQSTDARETVRRLEGWLVGPHRFSVDGQDAQLRIHAVRPMAQPVGAFFEWGLGFDGQWARDRADFMTPVAVLDCGFSTLDLFSVEGGRINVRYTGGDTVGMRRAATALVESVRRQYQRPLSLHEADELLRQYVAGAGRRVVDMPLAGGQVDVRGLIHAALDATAGEVTAFVDRVWGNARQFSHLLLTGGGCLALGERLLKQMPHSVLLDDPVTANARGLARLAQRPGLF